MYHKVHGQSEWCVPWNLAARTHFLVSLPCLVLPNIMICFHTIAPLEMQRILDRKSFILACIPSPWLDTFLLVGQSFLF